MESPDVKPPEAETPIANGWEGTGEAENPIAHGGRVRARQKGRREGRARLPWRWGSRWLGVLSFPFFLVRPGTGFSFLCLEELGGRRSGSPGLSLIEMGTGFGLCASR